MKDEVVSSRIKKNKISNSPNKIHLLLSDKIDENTQVYFFDNIPKYLNFLFNKYDNSEMGQKALEFFHKIEKNLTIKKWSLLSIKEKLIYLNSKIEYFNNLTNSKKKLCLQIDKNIATIQLEINQLQELIYEKEINYEKIGGHSEMERIAEEINKLSIRVNDNYSLKYVEVEKKINNCEQLIKNYENPIDSYPIHEILAGLKEENKRLKNDIKKQNEIISELDMQVNQLNESVKILEKKISGNEINK